MTNFVNILILILMEAIATNKKAYFDYEILETYEAGIELRGFEVKAIKTGHANLMGAYVIIRDHEVWLINADIHPYQPANTPSDYDSKRNRKLLLRRDEISALIGHAQEKKLTIVPLKIYTKNRRIKIEIGLARGKKKADKRETIRKRDVKREIERILKN